VADGAGTTLRLGVKIEADTRSAKTEVASFRAELQQLGAVGAGEGVGALGAVGQAAEAGLQGAAAAAAAVASSAGAIAGAASAAEAGLQGEGQAATQAAAALGSAAEAARAVAAASSPIAAGADAAEQAIRGESQAANENTAALLATTGALRAFISALNDGRSAIPPVNDNLSGQARALRDIIETADPAARRVRQLAEAEAVLARAVSEGTISQTRATELMQRYSQQATIASAGGSRFGNVTQQAGYQVGDFAVQVASGQSALVAFTQQGAQVLGVFGPWGAILGAAVAVAGALAVGMGLFEDETVSSDEALKIHEATLKRWTNSGELAKQKGDQLALTFAGMSGAAREAAAVDLQSQIDEQLAGIDKGADEALKKLGSIGVAFDEAYSRPVGEFGQTVDFPARLRLDFEIPPDLQAKIQTALQPLFEGNRDRGFLAGLHDQLEAIAGQTTGEARTAIEGIASSVSRLSTSAQGGSEEIRLLEARMRFARGTATELDKALIDAAIAAGKLGSSARDSADMVDRLIGSIDRFLGMKVAQGIADKAQSFGGQLLQAVDAARARAEIQRMIDEDTADAAAAAGGQAAQRARQVQQAIDKARAQAGQIAWANGVPDAAGQIDAAGVAAGAAKQAEFDAQDRKAAQRQAQRENDFTRESERVLKATQDARTQADAIGLTSRAAAELKTQQDLLNAAHNAGIPINDQLLEKIKGQAAAYGEASEALRQLQTQERQRQQLVGEGISAVGATATPEETAARELERLRRAQALIRAGDPRTLDQLAEAGLSADEVGTGIERQITRLQNPGIYSALDGARASFGEFFKTLTKGGEESAASLESLGDSLQNLLIDKAISQPLDKLAGQGIDALVGAATGGDSGWIGRLFGDTPANDNPAASALSALSTANATVSAATAVINVGAATGLGGAIGAVTGGLIPDRPDVQLDGLAGQLGGTTLKGGAGTDVLAQGVDQIGGALQGVAQGVAQQGQGFLGGFGGALGTIINGIGSLLGQAGGDLGGIVSGIGSIIGMFGRGAAFGPGVVAFAEGGVPNGGGVFDIPTLFPMAGGKLGILSEELRDEAIMPLVNAGGSRSVKARGRDGKIVPLPLSRLPDGDLGVVMPPIAAFASGGVFGSGGGWSGGGGSDGAVNITVVPPPGVPLGGPKVEQRRNPDGSRDLRLIFAELIGGELADPNSVASDGLQQQQLRGR
jgi:hypothetical protein